MRRFCLIAMCILFILSAGGCIQVSDPQSNILNVTTEDFDMKTAETMVQDLESPILDLHAGDTITRSQYNELQKESELFSDEHGQNMLITFFDVADVENPSKQEFKVLGTYWYPTVFDEGIEVAKAYIETTTYKVGDPWTILHIEERYTGGGDKLKNFMRGYWFEADESGIWHLIQIEGVTNLPVEDAD